MVRYVSLLADGGRPLRHLPLRINDLGGTFRRSPHRSRHPAGAGSSRPRWPLIEPRRAVRCVPPDAPNAQGVRESTIRVWDIAHAFRRG